MPIVVQCGACQKQFQAGDHLAGKKVKCPGCQTPLIIPGGQAAPQQPSAAAAPNPFNDLLAEELPTRQGGVPGMADTKCPGCGAVVNPEAVLCVDCGYDFQKQKKVVPDTPSDREARFEARADKMSGRDVIRTPSKKGGRSGGGEGIGWILFSFEGRIPRRIFWAASVGIGAFNMVCVFVAMALAGAVGGPAEGEEAGGNVGTLFVIVLVVLMVPLLVGTIASLAVQVKRLHDRGRQGILVLLPAIPFIGPLLAIWLFVETGLLRGTVGPNEYGDDPT
jgi:uncharacterized membrane protein YhaH (DUF805 family)